MPIYKNGVEYSKAYKGDHRPVNIYKGNNKIAGWHTETMSGQQLTFTGTYNDTVMDLTIDGDTSGNLISRGKNLIKNNEGLFPSLARCSLSFTGGMYTFTANANASFPLFCSIPIPLKMNTQYTLSFKGYSNLAGNSLGVFLSYDNHPDAHEIGLIKLTGTETTHSISFVATNDTLYIKAYLTYSPADAVWVLKEIQLEEGSIATPYEPFRGYFTIPIENINDPSEIPTLYPTTIIETDSAVAPTITATVKVMD